MPFTERGKTARGEDLCWEREERLVLGMCLKEDAEREVGVQGRGPS